MVTVAFPKPPVKPTNVIRYFDRIVVWLKVPADKATIDNFREQYGRKFHCSNRRAQFDRSFRQRLEFKQTKPETLAWIGGRDDAYVNLVEVSLDYILASISDQIRLWDFLHRLLVKRWHGKQEIRLVSRSETGKPSKRSPATTRYASDSRKPGHHPIFYDEKASRLTGESHCLHLEWKANGRKAVQGIGIETGRDLVSFDHHGFWKQRMLLLDVDVERLGRLYRNRVSGRKSRRAGFKRDWRGNLVNLDRRLGDILVNSVQGDRGSTVQGLIDRYGFMLKLASILAQVPNHVFLPDEIIAKSLEVTGEARRLGGSATYITV